MRHLPFQALAFSIVLFVLYTEGHAVSVGIVISEKVEQKGRHDAERLPSGLVWNGTSDKRKDENQDRLDAERLPSGLVWKGTSDKGKDENHVAESLPTGLVWKGASDKGEEERQDKHDAERQRSAQVSKPTYRKHKKNKERHANRVTKSGTKFSSAERTSDEGEEERQDRYDAERQPSAQVWKPTYRKHKKSKERHANLVTKGGTKFSSVERTSDEGEEERQVRYNAKRQPSAQVSKPTYRKHKRNKERHAKLVSKGGTKISSAERTSDEEEKERQVRYNAKRQPSVQVSKPTYRKHKRNKERHANLVTKGGTKFSSAERTSDEGEEERQVRYNAKRQPSAQVSKPTYRKHKRNKERHANLVTKGGTKISRAERTSDEKEEERQGRYDGKRLTSAQGSKPTYRKHKRNKERHANLVTKGGTKFSSAERSSYEKEEERHDRYDAERLRSSQESKPTYRKHKKSKKDRQANLVTKGGTKFSSTERTSYEKEEERHDRYDA